MPSPARSPRVSHLPRRHPSRPASIPRSPPARDSPGAGVPSSLQASPPPPVLASLLPGKTASFLPCSGSSGSLSPAARAEERRAPLATCPCLPRSNQPRWLALRTPTGSRCWWAPRARSCPRRGARGWPRATRSEGGGGVPGPSHPVLCAPGQGALPRPFPAWPPAVRFGIGGLITVLISTFAAQTFRPKIARRARETEGLGDAFA